MLNVPQSHITYIPQEIEIAGSQKIISQVRSMSEDKKGHLMTIVQLFWGQGLDDY